MEEMKKVWELPPYEAQTLLAYTGIHEAVNVKIIRRTEQNTGKFSPTIYSSRTLHQKLEDVFFQSIKVIHFLVLVATYLFHLKSQALPINIHALVVIRGKVDLRILNYILGSLDHIFSFLQSIWENVCMNDRNCECEISRLELAPWL